MPRPGDRNSTEDKILIVSHLRRSLIFQRRPLGCPRPLFPGNGTPAIPNAAKFAELISLPAGSAHRISSGRATAANTLGTGQTWGKLTVARKEYNRRCSRQKAG